MPEFDYCSSCGKFTIVHGNKGQDKGGFGARVLLCDECCPCYNHCPPVYGKGSGGKYHYLTMKERLGLQEIMENI